MCGCSIVHNYDKDNIYVAVLFIIMIRRIYMWQYCS